MATKKTAKPQPATDPDFTTPILDLIREVVPEPDLFLDSRNTVLGLRTPRDVIQDPAGERRVREMVLRYKYGIYA